MARRFPGVEHGAFHDRLSWRESLEKEARELGYTQQPYVVIVGGGQGGIALGARLRQLGVPAIIVERNERPGDSWRNRYKSLCLHDPVWYDHLPYYWGSTTCESASYDDETGKWTILHEFQIPVYEAIAERDADFCARLEKAGFRHEWGRRSRRRRAGPT